MMLSEGRAGIDNLYYLKEGSTSSILVFVLSPVFGFAVTHGSRFYTIGLLTLELSKETYERAGLVGQAIRDGGRKHLKTRYCRYMLLCHQTYQDSDLMNTQR